MRKGLVWGVVAFALVAAACGSEGGDIDSNPWVLNGLGIDDGQLITVPEHLELTLQFSDGEASGFGGCNRFFGPYSIDGDTISIGPLGRTLAFCPDQAIEDIYLTALQAATTVEAGDGSLVLTNASGARLTFAELVPAALSGPTWDGVSYFNGKGVSSLVIGTAITALFGDDGTLSGNAGCNNYMAPYEVDGSRLTIGAAATTRIACQDPEGIMEQEAEYLAALQLVTHYEIVSNRLRLYSENDVDIPGVGTSSGITIANFTTDR